MWLQKLLKSKASKLCFLAFVFTLPFQTAFLVYESSWGRGFVNPYTSIFFSVSEAFLLLSCFFWLKENKGKAIRIGKKKLFFSFLFCLSAAMLSLVFSESSDSILRFLLVVSLLETLIVYLLIVNKVAKVRELFWALSVSLSFQAVLAIVQVFLGHDLGLNLLGEPNLSVSSVNVAKIELMNWTFLRGYGTFSHPNILAGFLNIGILGTLLYPPERNSHRNILLLLFGLGLVASFSRTGLLGLIMASLLLSYRSVPLLKEKTKQFQSLLIIGLFFIELLVLVVTRPLPIFNDPALQTRIEGYKNAIQLFVEMPIGTGWSLETLHLEKTASEPMMPWEYQPTHNIFLAMGVVVLITGSLDHYWMSLESGRFLAIVIFASISRFLSDPLPIKAIKKAKHSNEIQPLLS